jgi:hypothetical protein
MTFITHEFRVSVVSDVRERVRDFRITTLKCIYRFVTSYLLSVKVTRENEKNKNSRLYASVSELFMV